LARASCGQKVGPLRPTATTRVLLDSGSLSTQAGTGRDESGFPQRFSPGEAFCGAFAAQAQSRRSRASARIELLVLGLLGRELVEGLVRVGAHGVAHLGVQLLHLVQVVLEA